MEILAGITPEAIGGRVAPNIAAVAAVTTQLDVVAMAATSGLEHEDQLMLTAVEAAHAGHMLRPYAEVLVLGEGAGTGGQRLGQVTPVHEHVDEGAAFRVVRNMPARGLEEALELLRGHFAGCHRKLAMGILTQPRNDAIDPNVERRVGDRGGRKLSGHETLVAIPFEG